MLHLGTVDEHVEEYREGLTQAFHAVCTPGAAGDPVPLGGRYLLEQTETLKQLGLDVPGKVSNDPATFKARAERRSAFFGVKPQQDETARDTLRRFVGTWIDRYTLERNPHGMGPTGAVCCIQSLIDALEVFRDDEAQAVNPVSGPHGPNGAADAWSEDHTEAIRQQLRDNQVAARNSGGTK